MLGLISCALDRGCVERWERPLLEVLWIDISSGRGAGGTCFVDGFFHKRKDNVGVSAPGVGE